MRGKQEPPRSTRNRSSTASEVYKKQIKNRCRKYSEEELKKTIAALEKTGHLRTEETEHPKNKKVIVKYFQK